MSQESFTIVDEGVTTNVYAAGRWLNVWWKYCESPDDMITIELEFETDDGMTTERFQTGEMSYEELLVNMLDRVTHYCTEAGIYNG